jgi:hypothetical protein
MFQSIDLDSSSTPVILIPKSAVLLGKPSTAASASDLSASRRSLAGGVELDDSRNGGRRWLLW